MEPDLEGLGRQGPDLEGMGRKVPDLEWLGRQGPDLEGLEGRVRIWKDWEAGFRLKAKAKNAGHKPRINLNVTGKSRIFFVGIDIVHHVQKSDSQSKLGSQTFSSIWTAESPPISFKSYVHKSAKSALFISFIFKFVVSEGRAWVSALLFLV